jgi:cytochrome P450
MKPDVSCLRILDADLPCLLELLSENKWYDTVDSHVLLLGDEGRRWFIDNEHLLVAPQAAAFYARDMNERFPVIMNFYPEAFHLDIKRRYATLLGRSALEKLETQFRMEAASLFSYETAEQEVDLFKSVTRTVISGQLRLFFGLSVEKETLALLADYEDIFSLGLYADSQTQDAWYAQTRFRLAEENFHKIFYSLDQTPVTLRGLADADDASTSGALGKLSHFYNLSVAGSTNVGKLFCEIVHAACEMGEGQLDWLIGNNGIETVTNQLTKEALRLLPWTDNQITLPFLSRTATESITLSQSLDVFEESTVYLLHCLEHLSEEIFPDPFSFLPQRWEAASYKRKAIYTFGVGRRKCCGEALVAIWLRVLLEEYLKRARFESKDGILYRSYDPSICDVGEFSFRGKLLLSNRTAPKTFYN